MEGNAALTAFVGRVRALGTMAADVAREAAPLVERGVRETAAAGTDPEGKPWSATKTGAHPLMHAADALTARPKGSSVEVILRGYYVFHNFGTRRDPKRWILPDGGAGIPPKIATVLREAADKVFARTMGGGR